MNQAEYIFWFSFLMIGYTYIGYPFMLFIWSRLLPKKVDKAYIVPEPMVSVVIAARNEAINIRAKIKNLFGQDYPADKLEIVLVSDGSTDSTAEEVQRIINNTHQKKGIPKLKLIEISENLGKPNALNVGVNAAKGEFIVFSDARQKFNDVAIKELIANFNDPEVGSVSGELILNEDSDSTFKIEMTTYWNLEKMVRKMESDLNSVAGATGAICAIRKSLFKTIPQETLLDDVFTPMNIVIMGYRNVLDGKAIAYDVLSKNAHQEKIRKIRTLLGNYQLIKLMPQLLSPVRNPIWLRYLSHKVLRLFIPFFYFILIAAAFFSEGFFYKLTLAGCILIFFLAYFYQRMASIPIVGEICKIARAFVWLNYFALLSFFYLILPYKRKVW